ncbi:MAG: riboflavin synthase [Dehalococcoidia bacterium]|nr:riboflavin synthase [Dehalococcoidia bacterium]
MFTGIIEEIGAVESAQAGRLTISARLVLEDAKLGDSIAVNGACLTVVKLDNEAFSVDIVPETVRRTTLGELRAGSPVNLERAISIGGRFGGHFVQGHIDAAGKIVSRTPHAEAVLMKFSAPGEVTRYIVEKGFVALDGVSLTVTERTADSFSISLIPFTAEHTTLGRRRVGDKVNIEVDILAKYVEQLSRRDGSAINAAFLAEHGFLAGS